MTVVDLLRYVLDIEDGDTAADVLRKAVDARDAQYKHDQPDVPWDERRAEIRAEVEAMLPDLIRVLL